MEELLTGRRAPLSQRELAEWAIWRKQNPFGPAVEDLKYGIQQAMFVNAHSSKSHTAKAEDFMLGSKAKQQKQMSVAEFVAAMKAAAIAAGGKVIDKRAQ